MSAIAKCSPAPRSATTFFLDKFSGLLVSNAYLVVLQGLKQAETMQRRMTPMTGAALQRQSSFLNSCSTQN
jgi:hypothetical protein